MLAECFFCLIMLKVLVSAVLEESLTDKFKEKKSVLAGLVAQ